MKTLAGWLRRLADWLDPVPVVRVPDLTPLEARTRGLVRAAASVQASGEYKRHQVYARLIQEFPDVAHTTIGIAIERAVEQL